MTALAWAPAGVSEKSQPLRLCEASHKRKNFLFAGADSGGERAANIYTLIGTALLNGVNTEAWLKHVLERIADLPVSRVGELVPWNVKDALSASHSKRLNYQLASRGHGWTLTILPRVYNEVR